jgi:hypothetical protein
MSHWVFCGVVDGCLSIFDDLAYILNMSSIGNLLGDFDGFVHNVF